MQKTYTRILLALLTVHAGALAVADEHAFTVEVKDQAAPETVPGHVKDLLAPKAYAVSNAEGVCYEFWLVTAIDFESEPADSAAAIEAMGEAFPVLGYVNIPKEESCIDFRDDPIDPGHYVIRGSFQPNNGDHLGTSPLKSGFMLFMPHEADDDDLANYDDREDMWEESLAPTESGHPPILNLQPMATLEGDLPRIEEDTEEEWVFLTMNLTGKVGDKTFDIPVRLVIDGIGDIE